MIVFWMVWKSLLISTPYLYLCILQMVIGIDFVFVSPLRISRSLSLSRLPSQSKCAPTFIWKCECLCGGPCQLLSGSFEWIL